MWMRCASHQKRLCAAHHRNSTGRTKGFAHVRHRSRDQHSGRDHRRCRDDRALQVQSGRVVGGRFGLPRTGGRTRRPGNDRRDHEGVRRHHGRSRPADRVRRSDGRDPAADRRHPTPGADAAQAVRPEADALRDVVDDRHLASVHLSRCAACHLGTARAESGEEDRQERNRADGDGHGHRARMRNRPDRSRCRRAGAGRPARCPARQVPAVRCAPRDPDRRDLRRDHVVPVQSWLVEPRARRAGVPRRRSRAARRRRTGQRTHQSRNESRGRDDRRAAESPPRRRRSPVRRRR